jgi:hypothetical protein
MNSIEAEQRKELLAGLLKLCDACPVHEDNPADCPLRAVRALKPAKRRQWLNTLSDDELKYLAEYHRVCFQVGTAKQPQTQARD